MSSDDVMIDVDIMGYSDDATIDETHNDMIKTEPVSNFKIIILFLAISFICVSLIIVILGISLTITKKL